jgi:hypothetical protein
MKKTARTLAANTERSVDYQDYRDVPRPMTVLVRDQQTGEYNAPHDHRHGGRCGFRPGSSTTS